MRSNGNRSNYDLSRRADDGYRASEDGWNAVNPTQEEDFALPSLSQERVETVTLPDGESVELRREVKLRRVQ